MEMRGAGCSVSPKRSRKVVRYIRGMVEVMVGRDGGWCWRGSAILSDFSEIGRWDARVVFVLCGGRIREVFDFSMQ